jgi:hypothetical protein
MIMPDGLIAEWRSHVCRRQAIQQVDVEELEDHLRNQVFDLWQSGLDEGEAFPGYSAFSQPTQIQPIEDGLTATTQYPGWPQFDPLTARQIAGQSRSRFP